MTVMPWLSDRGAVADAAELIRLHGRKAGDAAAKRADGYRNIGNHLNFCRWRQIERLIQMLSGDQPFGTIH